MTGYTAINLVNAALVVGFALLAVHQGIGAVAVSWALAQAASAGRWRVHPRRTECVR